MSYKPTSLCKERELRKKAERERDEALMDRGNGDIATMTRNHYERILRERDEARAVADELASAASHCLGWHDCRLRIGEKITATLQRWRRIKGEQ